MRIDLHVHSSVSDGTDSPPRLVVAAREAGLDVIALCDHDTFDGLVEATTAGQQIGVEVLAGVELSTRYQGKSVHLLGYGCDPRHPELSTEMKRLRASRAGRLEKYLQRLAELGMPLTADEVMTQVGLSPSLGRPHIADAMVAKGYVKDRDEAFGLYLSEGGPAYVRRYATDLREAIAMVRRAKGVPVVAHPWGRGNRDRLSEDVIESLAADGLDGIEVDHTDHDARDRERLARLSERTGLIHTGGSDYHGTGKPNNPLGINTTSLSAYREILRRIAERGGVLPS